MEQRIRLIRDLLSFSKLLVKIKISFDGSLGDTSGANFALPGLDKVQTLRNFALLEDKFSK